MGRGPNVKQLRLEWGLLHCGGLLRNEVMANIIFFPEMKMLLSGCNVASGAVWKPVRVADFSADGDQRACPSYSPHPASCFPAQLLVCYLQLCNQALMGGKCGLSSEMGPKCRPFNWFGPHADQVRNCGPLR